MDPSFFQSTTFSNLVVPILIFFGRITDVTIGTLRIIYVARGLRLLSAVAGFIEVLIWLLVIRQIMANLDHWPNYITYAAGFAAGNYIGISIEHHIALGNILIRIITRREATELEGYLRDKGYSVTSVEALGEAGPVKVLFMVTRRKSLEGAVEIIKRFNPLAFYTVEDLRYVSQPLRSVFHQRKLLQYRKSGKK